MKRIYFELSNHEPVLLFETDGETVLHDIVLESGSKAELVFADGVNRAELYPPDQLKGLLEKYVFSKGQKVYGCVNQGRTVKGYLVFKKPPRGRIAQ